MKFKELYNVLDMDEYINVYVLRSDDYELVYGDIAYFIEGSFTWFEIEDFKVQSIISHRCNFGKGCIIAIYLDERK